MAPGKKPRGRPKGWATEEQKAFFDLWMAEFLVKKASKRLDDFWPRMLNAWFSEFPEELELGYPLQDMDEDPDAESPDTLTPEQRATLSEAIGVREKQLRAGFYNRFAKVNSRGGNTRSTVSLAAQLFKARPKRKRRHQVLELYQMEHKHALNTKLIAAGYNKLNEAAQCRDEEGEWIDDDDDEEKMARLTEMRKERMRLQRRVVREAWDALPEEEKARIRELAKKEVPNPAKASDEDEDEDETQGERTPEEYQMSLDESLGVLEMFLAEFARMTGWVGVMVYAGPVPRMGGELGMKSACFGRTPGGLNFEQFHENWKKGVAGPLAKFARQAISRKTCLDRAIFTPEDVGDAPEDVQQTPEPAKKAKTKKKKTSAGSSAVTPLAPETPPETGAAGSKPDRRPRAKAVKKKTALAVPAPVAAETGPSMTADMEMEYENADDHVDDRPDDPVDNPVENYVDNHGVTQHLMVQGGNGSQNAGYAGYGSHSAGYARYQSQNTEDGSGYGSQSAAQNATMAEETQGYQDTPRHQLRLFASQSTSQGYPDTPRHQLFRSQSTSIGASGDFLFPSSDLPLAYSGVSDLDHFGWPANTFHADDDDPLAGMDLLGLLGNDADTHNGDASQPQNAAQTGEEETWRPPSSPVASSFSANRNAMPDAASSQENARSATPGRVMDRIPDAQSASAPARPQPRPLTSADRAARALAAYEESFGKRPQFHSIWSDVPRNDGVEPRPRTPTKTPSSSSSYTPTLGTEAPIHVARAAVNGASITSSNSAGTRESSAEPFPASLPPRMEQPFPASLPPRMRPSPARGGSTAPTGDTRKPPDTRAPPIYPRSRPMSNQPTLPKLKPTQEQVAASMARARAAKVKPGKKGGKKGKKKGGEDADEELAEEEEEDTEPTTNPATAAHVPEAPALVFTQTNSNRRRAQEQTRAEKEKKAADAAAAKAAPRAGDIMVQNPARNDYNVVVTVPQGSGRPRRDIVPPKNRGNRGAVQSLVDLKQAAEDAELVKRLAGTETATGKGKRKATSENAAPAKRARRRV